MTFQMHLARSLIEYAEEGALGEAGGNKTRVSWLRQRQARSDTTPSQQPPSVTDRQSIALLMSLVILSVKFAAWLHSSSCIRPTSYGTLAGVRKCEVALPAMWSCACIAARTIGTMRRAA